MNERSLHVEEFRSFVIHFMNDYGGCIPEIMILLQAHRAHFGRPPTKIRLSVMREHLFTIITKRVEPCGDIYWDLKPEFMFDRPRRISYEEIEDAYLQELDYDILDLNDSVY